MSKQKKFGAFDGVFTPSILTILGVIMYLRMGWVVGNAGLWGTLAIVLIAHIISFSTGLSISSISTDKKVGAGGVYYVLSRSLGLPIGGAIGLTLFVGTALSISLYLVGFSESFNTYLGLSTDINGLRSTGSLFLLVLTIIAFISTSVAIKTQFIILTAIILSLISIFAGGGAASTEAVPAFGGEGVASMETVFAIFFPAVTGFTAGIAMSGDLKNPKKDIPGGTIAAITVGLVVYVALAVFISIKVDQVQLLSDYNILTKIAVFGPAVIAGVWGATLSSAIGGILGGPRILQAMSLDRITPKLFGKGVGFNNEPRNALILTVLISEAGILIGELDQIARIVSMFYLAAYGFINISFFLESWASSDFKPSFKVSKWVGLVGFIATFTVMFKLDMVAMVAAFVVIGGIFLWLQRKQISLGTGDVWQSVWSTVVKSGLKRMETADDHKRNWKPNIILFSGDIEARPHLIEFGKAVAGQAGVITNFDLIENEKAKVLFPKHKQSVSDELLQKHGVFGRRIEVKNVYDGIETIAATFGFSGLDPNTVLMGWARNTKSPVFFAQMTEKLIELDYNVLYLDYDKRWGFRKREQIDMWWRGISNNAELMMHLARFLSTSPDWRNAHIRVLLVNDYNVDRRIIEKHIQQLLDEFRVQAEIKVINNAVDRKSFYQLMKILSAEADLIMIGIPNIEAGKEASFVERTNNLVGVIGTTLLVKASSTFETTKLGLKEFQEKQAYEPQQQQALPVLAETEDQRLKEQVKQVDEKLGDAISQFCKTAPSILQQHYQQWLSEQQDLLRVVFDRLLEPSEGVFPILQEGLHELTELSLQLRSQELEILKGVLSEGIAAYQKNVASIAGHLPDQWIVEGGKKKKVKLNLRRTFEQLQASQTETSLLKALHHLGLANAKLLRMSSKKIREVFLRLSLGVASEEPWETTLTEAHKQLETVFAELSHLVQEMVDLLDFELRNANRNLCNQLLQSAGPGKQEKAIVQTGGSLKTKEKKTLQNKIQNYGTNWYQNQQLFQQQYEVDLQLAQAALRLKEIKGWAVSRLQKEYVGPVLKGIHSLQETAVELQKSLKESNEKEWETLPLHQEEEHDNIDSVLWRFMDAVRAIGQLVPQEVELMDEDARNSFQQGQQTELTTMELKLSEIVAFLINDQFSLPFQNQLLLLREQFNRISGRVNNHSSLINYGLEAMREDPRGKELTAILEKASTELKRLEENASNIFDSVKTEIREKYESTEALLTIDHLVIKANELSQHVRKENRRRGLVEWREWAERGMQNLQKDLAAFVARKKEDVQDARFEQVYESVRSDSGRLRTYREVLCPGPTVEKLPFYYRQLFTGRHLNLGREAKSRQREIELVRKAIAYHDEGLEGAIMITGEPLSGKSYFAEYLLRHHLTGPGYRVVPPAGGSMAPRGLQMAFEQAIGQRGNLESLLAEMPDGCVFLLEDIELWWLNKEEGSRPLSVLLSFIRQFSRRHYFLLTASLEALKLMRKNTAIDERLLTTIILTPMSPATLRQILWSRHKTGGVSFQFDQVPEAELTDKEWRSIVMRLHKRSDGNVGVVLWRWLAQVGKESDEDFAFDSRLGIPEFPELEDASWYFILMQLYIHKALSRRRFSVLFAPEPKEWIDSRIQELKKANILAPHGGDLLELHPLIRRQLGLFLKEKGLL
jgi:solute carrier family 12 sodium/potassium/chloride transporter 2